MRLSAAKSTSYGKNLVLIRACPLWNSLLQSVKYSQSMLELKPKKKDLGNSDCSCILCRLIVQRIKIIYITPRGCMKLF